MPTRSARRVLSARRGGAARLCRGRGTERLGAERHGPDRSPDVLDGRAVSEVAFGGMVGDAVVVERRLRLAEVLCVPQPDRRREDVVVDVVEMVPEGDIQRQDAAVGEVADHERIADLRSKGDVLGLRQQPAHFFFFSVRMRKGVVGDERAEAVGENDVGLVLAHGVEHALAALALEARLRPRPPHSLPSI